MEYLIKPHDGIFVATSESFAGNQSVDEVVNQLRKKTQAVQTWFFDLDDNHAPSPAKLIAKRAIGTYHFSPKYIRWLAGAALDHLRYGKAAESLVWEHYVDTFLTGREAQERLQQLFTPETACQSLYPGVEEFCQVVSGTQRFYVTRNVAEVAYAYTAALGFDGFFPEAFDKGRAIEGYIKAHPAIHHFGVDGDSEEDAAMIDVLRFYKKEVLGVYSMNKPNGKVHPSFDVFTSKDRTGLVRLIGEEMTHESD